MTIDNQKRLYEHYKKEGNKENIEMMEKAYPEFKVQVKAVEKNKKVE